MNRQPDNRSQLSYAQAEQEEEAVAALEDYLDYLCAPTLGIVPYDERCKLRLQARDHILAIAAEAEAQGMSAQKANMFAMRLHGEPWRIGQSYADTWRRSPGSLTSAPRLGTDVMLCFAFFGLPAIAILLLAEQNAYGSTPVEEGYGIVLALLAPFVAGFLAGAKVSSRPARAICFALVPLILVTLGVAVQLLPYPMGFYFALVQLFFWLPVGRLTASTTARFTLSYRRRRFVRLASGRVRQ